MVVLRSRVVTPSETPLSKTLKERPNFEPPSTPARTSEPASFVDSSTPDAEYSPNQGVLRTRSAPLPARRRSLRLASDSGPGQGEVVNEVPNGHRRKRKKVASVEGADLITEKGDGRSELLGETVIMRSEEENAVGAEGKGKKSAENGVSFALSNGEENKRLMNLRYGKRISQGGTVGKCGDGILIEKSREEDHSVKKKPDCSADKKGKGKVVYSDFKESGSIVAIQRALSGDYGGPMKEKQETAEEKDASNSENVAVRVLRRRFSREEKGKALADGNLLSNALHDDETVKSEVERSVDDIDRNILAPAVNEELQDESNDRVTSSAVDGTRRPAYDRFHEAARRNASRFAHFVDPGEDQDGTSTEAERDTILEEQEEEVEDWPGPFSTAMKIIKDREKRMNSQTASSCSDKTKHLPLIWTPKKREGQECSKRVAPSLQELCLRILANNADAIVSLESVPDALRHKLSQILCDSRRMNSHFFELLIDGSPTEVCLMDCSWLTEEQFTSSFQRCDTSRLTVLQLDQCGRCMPDYVLLSTLARTSNSLPVLTKLSLGGACRLSDIGMKALVSSAPRLRSINLGQCSLLTSCSINILADSLGLILRELYINDCQSIDAIDILPALKKLEHLEVLSLKGISNVCDKFMREFITARGYNIKELVLTDCGRLTDSSIKVIAEHCSGLYALDLSNLCKLTDSALGYLANGCRAIQTLKLCRNPFSDEAVAAFLETSGDCLQDISLNSVKKVSHNTANSLARRSRNLKVLDLSWCRNLTDDAVGLIVDSCLSLKVLKLFGCTQITNVFLDNHSNAEVQIIGLTMSSFLGHLKLVGPQFGPLKYSAACWE